MRILCINFDAGFARSLQESFRDLNSIKFTLENVSYLKSDGLIDNNFDIILFKNLRLTDLQNMEFNFESIPCLLIGNYPEDSLLKIIELGFKIVFSEYKNSNLLIKNFKAFLSIKPMKREGIRINRNNELYEIIQSLAHDLRSKLLSIQGYTLLLQSEFDESLVTNINKITQNIHNLLDRSTALADAGQLIKNVEIVDLNVLFQDLVKEIVPSKIEVLIDKLPLVRCDQIKIAQVFQNLLENAVIHGHPNQISIQMNYVNASNLVEILLSNDGKMIPIDLRDKIFQRGFTTKKNGTGFGLGLSIINNIIDAHGWNIYLDNISRSTFRITIPREDIYESSD